MSSPITEETSGIDATGMYDDLDCKIVDALAVDPKVFWSTKQRLAIRGLIHSYTEAEVAKKDDEYFQLIFTMQRAIDHGNGLDLYQLQDLSARLTQNSKEETE